MALVNSNPHWRDSARNVRFFIWDGKTAFPMLLLILHVSWWTFGIAIASTLFFTLLNRYGFTPVVFGRLLRNAIAGRRKISTHWWEA